MENLTWNNYYVFTLKRKVLQPYKITTILTKEMVEEVIATTGFNNHSVLDESTYIEMLANGVNLGDIETINEAEKIHFTV